MSPRAREREMKASSKIKGKYGLVARKREIKDNEMEKKKKKF